MKVYLKAMDQSDMEVVMSVIEETKKVFKHMGIDQWQNSYPNEGTILNDLKDKNGYTINVENKVIGYVAIQFEPDPNYNEIKGAWSTTGVYATIHRLAIDPNNRGKGYALKAMDSIETIILKKSVSTIRVDTGYDNEGMRNLLKKLGYSECGEVRVNDGLRIAYDKRLTYGKIN